MAELVRGNFNSAGDVTDGGLFTHTGTGSLSIDSSSPSPAEGASYLKHSGPGNDWDTYTPGASVANCGVCFYFYVGSIGSNDMVVVNLFNSGPGAFYTWEYLNAVPAWAFVYVDSTSTPVQVGTSPTLTANTWYQLEMGHQANTLVSAKVWNQNGDSLIMSGTVNTNVRNLNIERIDFGGINNPGGTQTYGFDVFRVGDAGLLGPISGAEQPIRLRQGGYKGQNNLGIAGGWYSKNPRELGDLNRRSMEATYKAFVARDSEIRNPRRGGERCLERSLLRGSIPSHLSDLR